MVPSDVIARPVVIAARGAGVARATGKTGEAGETMWSSHVDMRCRMTGHTTPHHDAPRRATRHHADHVVGVGAHPGQAIYRRTAAR